MVRCEIEVIDGMFGSSGTADESANSHSPQSPHGRPVFTADFSSREQWVAGRSWAYPNGGPTNPGDDKLDHLTADPEYSRAGVFRATRMPQGTWKTGLLTTEGSADGFMVRTGDILETRVRLPVSRVRGRRSGHGWTAATRSTCSSTTRTIRICWSCRTM